MEGEFMTFIVVIYDIVSLPESIEKIARLEAEVKKTWDLGQTMSVSESGCLNVVVFSIESEAGKVELGVWGGENRR